MPQNDPVDDDTRRNRSTTDLNRRDVIKHLSAGAAGTIGISQVGTAEQGISRIDTKSLDELKEGYVDKSEDELKSIFDNNTSELFGMLASPIDTIDNLPGLLPDEIRKSKSDGLIEPQGKSPSEFFGELSSLSFNVTNEISTANILMEKQLSGFNLILAAEPEADRSYAIMEIDDELDSENENIVINDRQVSASACIGGTGCKANCGEPCQDCPSGCKCYWFDVYCCDGYCYWGSDNSSLCSGDNCCPNCEYWCDTWDNCHG